MTTNRAFLSLDAAVADIKNRLEVAQRARGRAEGEQDAARSAADTARRQLAEEFGVTSVDDARALLDSLTTQLTDQIERIRAALDEIGM